MSQVYVFTGENTYRIRQERRRWIDEFAKKFGEDNCTIVDASDVTVRDLLDDVAVLPFFGEKRLVVVDGIPSATKEEVQALFAQIHPSVILVFVASKIDKRGGGAKEMLAKADVKEFPPLKGKQFTDWMALESKEHGLALSEKAKLSLLEFIGEDQDLMSGEIRKLALYSNGKTLSEDDIERTVIPMDEGIIWKISDLLCMGSKDKALLYAHRMINRGGDAYGLWAILLSVLRNLIAVSAATSAGKKTAKDIADASGVHIFAVRSMQEYAKRADAESLAAFLTWAARSDKALKTGEIRATEEAPQEIRALIDSFILRAP